MVLNYPIRSRIVTVLLTKKVCVHKTLRNTISDCIIDGLQRPEGKGGWGNSVCSIANMLAVMQMCVFFFPLFRVRPKSGGVSGEIVGCVVPDCFFFVAPFFSQRVWLELSYWTAARHVPFIYRRLRMWKETGPSPSHCSFNTPW